MDVLHDLLQRNVAQIQANLRQAGSRAADLCQALQPQPGLAPMLASVSARLAGARAGAPQPLFEVAFNPENIKARLNAVPVFAVVNNKNEFVLVAGEGDAKQLGLFFFSESEAQAMLKSIKEANAKLGKQAKVAATSMDRVYEFASASREATGTEGVVFRFMPDPRQVEAAMQLYRHAGVPATGFQGVPLFQAEGLTIKGDDQRYTPLFFSKADLDAALGAAYSNKDAAAQADTRAKADRARSEVQEAEGELAAAASERDRKVAQRKAKQAKERLQKYEQRLAEASKHQKLPRVDVGSLEEVIGRMENDEKQEWSDVVFVPPRSVAAK